MPNRMMKDRTLTFRLPEDIYQKIDHLAEEKWCSSFSSSEECHSQRTECE